MKNDKIYRRFGRIGATGITLGILAIAAGVSIGVIGIINGAMALVSRRNMMM